MVDRRGTTWALGVIDVSVRYGDRMVLAEAPVPGISAELTRSVREAAVRFAGAKGKPGAFTVSFLADAAKGEHRFAGTAAGLDLTSVGWQTKLVGKGPTAGVGGSQTQSMCAGMGLVYLTAGSKPASGLFIDKINPGAAAPCGAHMPNLSVMLSASDFACFQSYLTTITSP